MVRILKSESNKVTVELTLEELSGVENDLEVYANEYDVISGDPPSDGSYELMEAIKAYWIGLQPKTPFDG